MHPMQSSAPPTLKPGMSHTIQSGESIEIFDNAGGSISVEGRLHQGVVTFLQAFDDWHLAEAAGASGLVVQGARAKLEAAWLGLPQHAKNVLRRPVGSAVLP